MEQFICTNCNYRFKASKREACPWCSKKDSVELEKSAEDLLAEVENM
jgi:rubrerythrin